MRVCLLVATRDRLAHLQGLLESCRRLIVPPETRLEVRVVDNASRDGTGPWLSGQVGELAPGVLVTAAYEALPGKSRALNRGLVDLEADWVAFADDDVRLSPEWLLGLVEGAGSGAEALQGAVELAEVGPAWWLTPRTRAVLAGTELFPREGLTELFGCNMAARNRPDLPRFHPGVGPATPFPFGEDTLWSRQLLALGVPSRFCPRMRALHVLGRRASLAEVTRRMHESGRNRLALAPAAERGALWRAALRELPLDLVRALLKFALGGRAHALDPWLDACRDWGCLLAPLTGIQKHPCWSAPR